MWPKLKELAWICLVRCMPWNCPRTALELLSNVHERQKGFPIELSLSSYLLATAMRWLTATYVRTRCIWSNFVGDVVWDEEVVETIWKPLGNWCGCFLRRLFVCEWVYVRKKVVLLSLLSALQCLDQACGGICAVIELQELQESGKVGFGDSRWPEIPQCTSLRASTVLEL